MSSYLDEQREIYGAAVVNRALSRLGLTDETAVQTGWEDWTAMKRAIKREAKREESRKRHRREQARRAALIRWRGRA